jgi:DNA excision repair protein ERCC-2
MSIKIDLVKKKISLGVGDLLAEPLRVGRVAGLSVRTRMALGREAHVGHQRAQADRHAGYAREIVVRYKTTVDGFTVTISGRIDGVYQPSNGKPWVIEEIKSVVLPPLMFGAIDANTYPHYVEQLRLYCFFVENDSDAGARSTGSGQRLSASKRPKVTGRMVFVNVADGSSKEIKVRKPFDDCEQLIAERVRLLIDQAQAEERHRNGRRTLADEIVFPHPRPRKHQDEMITAVERALAKGRHLLVSAPSGIGKTAGVLYPVLKYAFAHDKRVFFVTAKNTQQQIALETLRRLETPTAVLFRAREKMCINSVYACREEFCPYLHDLAAKVERTGVLDRLLAERLITPEMMMDAGHAAKVCPFELALMESERTDVIVCDYNYVFDPQVYFRRFFLDADYSDAVLVIDEAHNLVQRAMDYYSPTLQRRQIEELAANLRHVEPSLAKDFCKFLGSLCEFFDSLDARHGGDEDSQVEGAPTDDGGKFLIEPPHAFFEDAKPAADKLAVRYMLDKITRGRAIPDDPVEQFLSDFGQFCSVLAMIPPSDKLAGEEFACLFDRADGQSLNILCKDPSQQLAPRLDGFHSVIAMSATLAPMEFYRGMLGFSSDRTDEAELSSPFPRENRKIAVVTGVLTTFRQRAAHYGKIAEVIATTAAARRGNYMALFPSYEFLRAVAERLPDGDWELKTQEPNMTEMQRNALLESFKQTEPPKLVLAVQGGLFAEGVDYPGELLSGVIVVSPALPQVSFERELMRRYYDQRHGKGFEFAYLYPGMNRVIQSVGRLIRMETDRGVAVLVCRRFTQPQYSTLFPSDWSETADGVVVCADRDDLAAALRAFWDCGG